jgi:hypothetical protein
LKLPGVDDAGDDGRPATLTQGGPVTLLRIVNEPQKGTDRIDCFLLSDDDDGDGEIRLASKNRLFRGQERGAERPVLRVHNRNAKSKLSRVLLALALKVSPDEAAGHARGA